MPTCAGAALTVFTILLAAVKLGHQCNLYGRKRGNEVLIFGGMQGLWNDDIKAINERAEMEDPGVLVERRSLELKEMCNQPRACIQQRTDIGNVSGLSFIPSSSFRGPVPSMTLVAQSRDEGAGDIAVPIQMLLNSLFKLCQTLRHGLSSCFKVAIGAVNLCLRPGIIGSPEAGREVVAGVFVKEA